MGPESSPYAPPEPARESPRSSSSGGRLRGDVATSRAPPRRHRALPRAPASVPAARGRDHRSAARPVRGGRGRSPARLHQRAGARPLPHAVEPLRPLRSRVARSPDLPPPAPLRVLGARGVPRARDHAAVVAPRHARLSYPPYRLVGPSPERQGRGQGQVGHCCQWPDGARRVREPAPSGQERLVGMGTRAACAAPPVDDGGADHPLSAALPEALRSARASPAGRCGVPGASVGRLSPLAPRALVARHGRRHRAGPERLHDVPALWPCRPPCSAPRDARERRDHGDRGRGPAGPVAGARARSARARAGAAVTCDVPRHDLPVALRLAALVSGAGGAPLRLQLPHRGLHTGPQARARLLHATHPPPRPADRPSRRQEPPVRAAAGGAARPLRAVVRDREDSAPGWGPPRRRRGTDWCGRCTARPRHLRGGGRSGPGPGDPRASAPGSRLDCLTPSGLATYDPSTFPSRVLQPQEPMIMRHRVIHLINPKTDSLTTRPLYFNRALYSPLAGLLAVAAGIPRDRYEVVLTDENIESIDFDLKADMVGISAMTSYVNRGYEIADQFRAKGVPVVMGGVHPSFMPQEADRKSVV